MSTGAPPEPSSSLSDRSLHDEHDPQRSTTGNFRGLLMPEDEREVLRGKLNQGWNDAVEKFRADTGKNLGDFRGGKDGVLGTLRKRYTDDGGDVGRKDELYNTMEKVLNCIEFTSGLAAQIGSLFFQPASVCFGALEMLISIPQAFKKLRDDLRGLFELIASFLVNFQVLKRADSRFGLDGALVEKTNEILLAMVDICKLSIEVPHHRWRRVMGNVFLKDEKVHDALEKFQSLIEEQNKLTVTSNLGATLGISATAQAIDGKVTKISEQMDTIEAFKTDDMNLKADREKIREIDSAFELTEADVRKPFSTLERDRSNLLDDTMETLAKQEPYIHWLRSKQRRRVLFLQGRTGSGRTYLLAALYRAICLNRKRRTRDDPKVYVAYYMFHRDNGITEANDYNPLRTALHVMASQIARQTDTYTKVLSRNLDMIKDAREFEDFWRELKLDDFEAPDDSTLYLFFDGLDRLKTSLWHLHNLLDPAKAVSEQPTRPRRKLQLRIIATGDRESVDSIGQAVPTIHVQQFNEPLLRNFGEREMDRMVRDGLVIRQKEELIEAVLNHAHGSFAVVTRRFEMIRDAVSKDQNFEDLLREIQSNKDSNSLLKGSDTLNRVCSELSFEHQQQLKQILYWTVFGCSWLTTEELEDVLLLYHGDESLEPLEHKIRNRFAPAVTFRGNKVMADSEVEDYVRNMDMGLSSPSEYPKITLEVKIEKVDGPVVKKFVWDPSKTYAVDDYRFANDTKTQERLEFSFAEAHYTIAMTCLKILNNDKIRPKAQRLLRYACEQLPNHIYFLESRNCYEALDQSQLHELGQSMIDFLADKENIDSVWNINVIPPRTWIYDRDNVLAIGKFLTNPSILCERAPRDRRAAEKMTTQTVDNPVPFLRDLAMVAASRWLDKEKAIEDQAQDCFHLVNAYLRLREIGLDSLRFQPQLSSPASGTASGEGLAGGNIEAAAPDAESQIQQRPSGETQSFEELQGKPNTIESPADTSASAPNGQSYPPQEVHSPRLDENASEKISPELPNEKMDQVFKSAKSSKGDKKSDAHVLYTDSFDDDNKASRDASFLAPNKITHDRVKEALEWSLEELRLKEDHFVFQRLGCTLMDDDNTAAIAYLKKSYDIAPSDDLGVRLRVANALADAHAHSSTAEAYNTLAPVIEEIRGLRGGKKFLPKEDSQLSDTLAKAARYLTKMQDDAGAADMYEDAFQCSPNSEWLPELIRLLCKTNQATRAQELFDQWKRLSACDRSRGPEAHLMKVARDGLLFEISTFFHSVRQSPLRKSIIDALTDAIDCDEDAPEYADKSALHFVRGLAQAFSVEDAESRAAVDEWEACLRTPASMNVDHGHLRAHSWTWAAQYHFDLCRRQLSERPGISTAEKTKLWKDLQDDIEEIQVSGGNASSPVDMPWAYVAAFARLAALDSDAKEVLRPDMSKAINILCDNDPENDSYGLSLLLRVLRCYGDIHGVYSVWSLFDRSRLTEKRENKWAAQLIMQNPEIDGASQRPESDLQDRPDLSDIPDSKNGQDDQNAPITSGILGTYYDCVCDGCDAEIHSFLEVEIWSCTFCPNLDFCKACYAKLKKNDLDRVICSHNHSHILMQHFDYEREEVQGQNVMIDFQSVTQDKDGCRRWEGGRIVGLNEWIDILRHDWGISQPDEP